MNIGIESYINVPVPTVDPRIALSMMPANPYPEFTDDVEDQLLRMMKFRDNSLETVIKKLAGNMSKEEIKERFRMVYYDFGNKGEIHMDGRAIVGFCTRLENSKYIMDFKYLLAEVA